MLKKYIALTSAVFCCLSFFNMTYASSEDSNSSQITQGGEISSSSDGNEGDYAVITHVVKVPDGRTYVAVDEKIENLTDVFYYNPYSSPIGYSLLENGYELSSQEEYGSNEIDTVNGSQKAEIIYSPQLVDINVTYYRSDESSDFEIGRLVDSAYVGESYIPEIPEMNGYKYVDIEPVTGIDKVTNGDNNILVKYTSSGEDRLASSEKDYVTDNSNSSSSRKTYRTYSSGDVVSASAAIIIEAVDNGDGKSVIHEHTENSFPGNRYVAKAPIIPGWSLSEDQEDKITVNAKDGENRVKFLYDKKIAKFDLEKSEHVKYISGYEDNTVRPQKEITRAEMASIVYNIIKKNTNLLNVNDNFIDVDDNAWYYNIVNYLADYDVLKGYPDGRFYPDKSITRAEFVSIVSSFSDNAYKESNDFIDVNNDHWASANINSVHANGWIDGYNDNTFGPDDNITRAEAIKIINTMLDRKLDDEDIPENISNYTDNLEGSWYYNDIIEASIDHDSVPSS